MKKILTLFFITFFNTQAMAYSVDHHERITEIAIDHFNRCVAEGHASNLQSISEKDKRTLVDGNLYEDLIGPIQRLRLWHFWDPERRNENGKLIDKTLHKRFDKIEKVLLNPMSLFKSKYSELGHLLHYLQDVTVPSHVVPIFHPAPPLFKADGFDKYDIDFYSLENDTTINCVNMLKDIPHNFNTLLDSYANHTLKAVTQVIPAEGNKDLTWSLYWRNPKKNKRFGKYGKLGNSFGKEVSVKRHKKDKDPFFISREIFDNFSKVLHIKALESTLRAIVLYQQNHTKELIFKNNNSLTIGPKYKHSHDHSHDHNHNH